MNRTIRYFLAVCYVLSFAQVHGQSLSSFATATRTDVPANRSSDGLQTYLSPTRTAVHPVTGEIYVLLSTAPAISVVDGAAMTVRRTIPLRFTPSDFCFSEKGDILYITEHIAHGKLHIVSSSTGKIRQSIPVGAYPAAVRINKEGTQAWVANRFSNDLSVIDLDKRKEMVRLPMVREPKSLALSPDGKTLAVGNYLPLQSALESPVSAQVTLVNLADMNVLGHIALEDGSQSVEDICFSVDGNYLYVTHLLSRYPFPATQLERGWMNTNALSIVDIPAGKHYKTVLLDDMYRGVANPRGMALSDDGGTLYIAASGTHELVRLQLSEMHRKLEESAFTDITHNLTFLSELKTRTPLHGKGAGYPLVKGENVFVADYFSGGLSVVDVQTFVAAKFIRLGEEPPADAKRKGEFFFADADLCFQNWQSCVSCHPGGRADGLNWDLVNDGLGNPKNTKSMLYAHVTPPCMITGIRADAETAVRAGIKHIQFATRSEEDATCIDAYLKSLTPLPSPYLTKKGKLSAPAKKGEKLFEQCGCLECHNGAYFTDGKKYDVGTGVEADANRAFDTPGLKEVWRTAPYLYNGSAQTIREVLTIFNKDDKHGVTSKLTKAEIEALEAYVLSL